MKITRNALSQIIREEYAKVSKRKRLKENVGLDMNSVGDMMSFIYDKLNDAVNVIDSDPESAILIIDDVMTMLQNSSIKHQDMLDGQPGDYAGPMKSV